ncbi:MAG: (2Fe-2S) ferredoxin domain-containing protein [Firmicutes bacterium]|nr:(2Fe-2S) ferredoxin domain-containing protein [Bacillota bacterium]
MIITVCIGSGCHVKGSRGIIKILQDLIHESGKDAEIELEACFCQGRCTEGVVVKFGDEIVTGVNKDNIAELFHDKMLEAEKHEHDCNE